MMDNDRIYFRLRLIEEMEYDAMKTMASIEPEIDMDVLHKFQALLIARRRHEKTKAEQLGSKSKQVLIKGI